MDRDDVEHPRSRYRAKYIIMRQLYEKGLPPEDTAKVLAIHINTLKNWCENMGIPYPENGPREFINNMTKSNVSLNHFPDDVEVPDYNTNWNIEDARNSTINSNKDEDNDRGDLGGVMEW